MLLFRERSDCQPDWKTAFQITKRGGEGWCWAFKRQFIRVCFYCNCPSQWKLFQLCKGVFQVGVEFHKFWQSDSQFHFILFVSWNWKLYDIVNYQLVFLNIKCENTEQYFDLFDNFVGFWRINEHVNRNSDCLNTVFTCTLSVHQDSCIF